MPKRSSYRRNRRYKRTMGVVRRRYYKNRYRSSSKKKNYMRTLQRMSSRYVRPCYTISTDENVAFSYTVPISLNNAYRITYYDSIGVGTASNQRTGDQIKACPGGYLKYHLQLNPAHSKFAEFMQAGLKIRIITFRLMNPNLGSIPGTDEELAEMFFANDRTIAIRRPDNYKLFKVLSDKVVVLDSQRPYVKRIVKHNWKGKVKWDRLASTPLTGFYHTIFQTQTTPIDSGPDITPALVQPVIGSISFKATWLNE